MNAPELLALSLGLSVVVAALGWAGGRGVERLSADPRLRDRVWAAALVLPAGPPLAVGLMLLTPAPVREIATAPVDLPTALAATPVEVEVVAVAPSAGLVFDPTLAAWAVLAIAALLAAARLAALALRARRLLRIVEQAEAPDPAVAAMVETAARALAIRAPRVRISAATPETLLASLGRARLILPAGLIAPAADPAGVRAVIAHELAHLKRGDHHALWLEEGLLALLAVNPLMPVLRARRAAAREEACDALALSGAAPEVRRAYARSLIEALRSRAAPQASGGLPALTFTGAGRNTAMHRLRAVMNPAPAAGRGPRLTAFGLGGLIVALAGAGSLAVAGEREVVILVGTIQPEAAAARMEGAGSAAAAAPLDEPSRTVDLAPDTRTLLNGAPLPEGLPMWAVAAERVDIRTSEDGARAVNLILAFTGTVTVSVDGRRMPSGFPVSGVSPEAVAGVETAGDHVMYTLKPEAEVRRARMNASRERSEARLANQPSETTLSPEQQARYRNPTGREYQALCASSEPGDEGFCAGVMFSQMQGRGLCLPTELDRGAETVRRAALGDLVTRGKAEIARASIRPGDRPVDIAREALARAYPCETAAADNVSALMSGPLVEPAEAADAARIETAGVVPERQAAGTAPAPGEPRESDFRADQRAAREATRNAWPAERGLRLPNWPRPERPARGSPFYNERRAADPQNARARS